MKKQVIIDYDEYNRMLERILDIDELLNELLKSVNEEEKKLINEYKNKYIFTF